MKKALLYWPLLFAIIVALLLILSAVFSRSPSTMPLFPSTNTGVSNTEILDARKNMGETLTNEETHLFTILKSRVRKIGRGS